MDVKSFAQQFATHGRALDVPTRTSSAKGAGPFHVVGFSGLGRFPQHKVQRVLFAALFVADRHAFTRVQFVQGLARQLAVTGELAHGKVHIAIAGAIRQAFLLQRADHGQHLRHIVGGAGLQLRPLDTQGIGVLVQGVDHAIGQAADGFAVFNGALDDLVVNVGDVAHVSDLQARGAQPTLHDVECHHGPRMPQMAQVVHRHAAHVHAHMTGFGGGEIDHVTRKRVVNAQAHENQKPLT